ncbi:MAG: FemAB family PEP-CTERM system-associated protein [Kiritimatiellae bacterium]|jgi:FemAB-related protein (PEP-CTERM system-associated)|nr:FemAB family PEP-CTERM system-associated protein [Kiritimatiellia bacterium]
MQIRTINDSDQPAWDQYVLNHPNGTVFHLSHWMNAIEKSFSHNNYYLVAVDVQEAVQKQRIVGILPLTQIKSFLFGHYLVSIPFAELGGVLADSLEIEATLVERATEIAKEIQCDYLELKNSQPVPELITKDLYYNFSKEILPELEDNMLAIPRKSRAAVRKGISSGLVATFGADQFDVFYELMARSYHSLGTPVFSEKLFRNLLENYGNNADLLIVRTAEGLPVSGVLTLFFNDRVMPYYAGSLPGFRNLCPNDFMYWELLKQGWEKGYKVFDLGRSKIDTGSFKFKKHWGFDQQPLFYQYQLIGAKELPNLSPANPKYKRKIEMWRKMPFALTKILGPPLAKYLG